MPCWSRNTTTLSMRQITSPGLYALLAQGAAQWWPHPGLQSHAFLDRAVSPAGLEPSLSPQWLTPKKCPLSLFCASLSAPWLTPPHPFRQPTTSLSSRLCSHKQGHRSQGHMHTPRHLDLETCILYLNTSNLQPLSAQLRKHIGLVVLCLL